MGHGTGAKRTPQGPAHCGLGHGCGWPDETPHTRKTRQLRQDDGDGGTEDTLGNVKQMGGVDCRKDPWKPPEFRGRKMEMYGKGPAATKPLGSREPNR